MQLGFLQNKSCLKLSLFCMRTDDWLNFHVKFHFQSIHVNITNTTHQFFSLFFYISKTYQTQKTKTKTCQTQNKCLHTCNVYKYSEKIHFLHAFDSFQPEWLLNVTWNIRYIIHVTWNMRYNSKNIRSWGSVPILLWNMSTASKANKHKYLFMIHGVCLILKEKLFFPCHACFSVTILRVGCSTLKWMNPLKNYT